MSLSPMLCLGLSLTTTGSVFAQNGALGNAGSGETLSATSGTVAVPPYGAAYYAHDGGSITGTGITVRLTGSDNAYAFWLETGGRLSLANSSITTNGGGAHGIVVDGSGSAVSASGVYVQTSGASYGILAQNGGSVVLNSGTIDNSGGGRGAGGYPCPERGGCQRHECSHRERH